MGQVMVIQDSYVMLHVVLQNGNKYHSLQQMHLIMVRAFNWCLLTSSSFFHLMWKSYWEALKFLKKLNRVGSSCKHTENFESFPGSISHECSSRNVMKKVGELGLAYGSGSEASRRKECAECKREEPGGRSSGRAASQERRI
jgi:hypothetical protein